MDGAREEHGRYGGREGGREGGKVQGRYPEEDTCQHTVFSFIKSQ